MLFPALRTACICAVRCDTKIWMSASVVIGRSNFLLYNGSNNKAIETNVTTESFLSSGTLSTNALWTAWKTKRKLESIPCQSSYQETPTTKNQTWTSQMLVIVILLLRTLCKVHTFLWREKHLTFWYWLYLTGSRSNISYVWDSRLSIRGYKNKNIHLSIKL